MPSRNAAKAQAAGVGPRRILINVRRAALLFCSLLAIPACGPQKTITLAPPPPAQISATDSLRQELTSIFSGPNFDRSYWSVMVRPASGGEDLFSLNARKLMMPGSVMKIVTLAAAAERLGWDHQFETKVVTAAPSDHGILRGDLIVVGGGDPSISERSDSVSQLQALARSVRRAGIERIEGGIIGDDDLFDDRGFGDGWTLDNLPYGYSAPVSALEYNEGSADLVISAGATPGEPVGIHVRPDGHALQIDNRLITAPESASGSLTLQRSPGSPRLLVQGQIPAKAQPFVRTASVDNPTRFFASAFRHALVAEGVQVVGDAIDIDDLESKPDAASRRMLASRQSPPLRDLAAVMMKVSQNQYAELLLKAAGGRRVVQDVLKSWDIAPDSYVIADGSGLSRYNYLSSDAVVRILHVLGESPRHASMFAQILPVAGREGALARRLTGTAAEGKVRAKTGTVDNVRAIAGYVETADDETLIFSMIANNFTVPASVIDAAADAALVRLATFTRQR
jgi:D-alanyl-D-alanine carboxypeptidase/D-alanyl-D-alanine-endopeptidase (penicillin-binding protein 4)